MLIIDADATPNVGEVELICKKHDVELLLVCDDTHEMNYEYAKVHICESSSQAADLYIISNITNNDVLVTQDYGLATILLDRAKCIINPKGFIYNDFNIELLNFSKHQGIKQRKKGKYTKTKKRTVNDKNKYLELIENQIANKL